MKKPRARLLTRKRVQYWPDAFVERVIWELPAAAAGPVHGYKYRLAYVVNGNCVLRYDNEARKGDHRHYGEVQSPYHFSSLEQLLTDFHNDIARWNHENRDI